MEETSVCCSSGMAQRDNNITIMKETLRAQQQLLQKLYAELDQEREASATAASEALDMILRLQGEKAAVKMEASHYKRIAEEKIGHAEATLEAFEELIYQKEMEIASLEFQVQAYKHKLLNLGCDLNASEFQFPEDFVSNNNSDQQIGENGQIISIRRLYSLPPIPLKNTLRAARKIERSSSPVQDVIPNVAGLSTDQEVSPPNFELSRTLDSYWSQIKMLDEKVRVISDFVEESEGEKCVNLRSRTGRSCSVFSSQAGSTMRNWDQTDKLTPTNSDAVNYGEGTQEKSVLDVFEVPQTNDKHKVSEHVKKRLQKWKSEADSRLTKPDSVSEGIMLEPHCKQDTLKQETKMHPPKDLMTMTGHRKEGMGVDCNAQAEFQKLLQRIENLERERISIRQEITHEGDGEEQLRLLKDIQSQLKLIQSEMRSRKTKKAIPEDDVHLGLLQEAMLHFWL